ncbi:MAG: 50S ribosomal protein L4 [Candidatus Calescibacterium sp.]|nr:50S ribosomal protein L4 [Candidatus Calescibacterium sp.]MDW8195505.1 50S ribosomal protein L4 [Candidatus Calescibacterium sp.]
MQKEVKIYKIDQEITPVDKIMISFLREPSVHHLHKHLVLQWSNRRLGTVSTKRRGEVRGGGRKPWPQKHTGRARHGSIRSPLWRKGGVVFGPKPRDWSIKMNKKERKLALYSLIYTKIDDFIVLDDYKIQECKTKVVKSMLDLIEKDFGKIKKVVIMYAEKDQNVENLIKSARNIEKVRKILKANNINVEDLLSADKVIMDKKSLLVLKELFVDYINKEVEEREQAAVKA